jgi:hypothetical protein
MHFTFTSIVAVTAVLAPAVSAISATNCETGEYHNWGSSTNGACHKFETSTRMRYDSDKGFALTVWSNDDCTGKFYTFKTQYTCVDIPFRGRSIKAT